MDHTDLYDRHFQFATEKYFGLHFEWKWFKAQGIAESNLEPDATSHCGAKGIMQIMPDTWGDIAKKIDIRDPFLPEDSIYAGIYYMRYLWNWWKKYDPPETEQLLICFASYNAGMWNIRKAQRLAVNYKWYGIQGIANSLPEITGENAQETIAYINRICRIKELL
uniref:Putative transglycosylase n=1 Tax=viral metagenome TaxID=1070528 RepID=A0A6M3IE97_9ZZZZ